MLILLLVVKEVLVVSSTIPLFGDDIEVILKYGGLPAAILILMGFILMYQNRQNAKLVSQMQEQFSKMSGLSISALNNNTAALSVLSTKLGMGCLLFQKVERSKSTSPIKSGEEDRKPT